MQQLAVFCLLLSRLDALQQMSFPRVLPRQAERKAAAHGFDVVNPSKIVCLPFCTFFKFLS